MKVNIVNCDNNLKLNILPHEKLSAIKSDDKCEVSCLDINCIQEKVSIGSSELQDSMVTYKKTNISSAENKTEIQHNVDELIVKILDEILMALDVILKKLEQEFNKDNVIDLAYLEEILGVLNSLLKGLDAVISFINNKSENKEGYKKSCQEELKLLKKIEEMVRGLSKYMYELQSKNMKKFQANLDNNLEDSVDSLQHIDNSLYGSCLDKRLKDLLDNSCRALIRSKLPIMIDDKKTILGSLLIEDNNLVV